MNYRSKFVNNIFQDNGNKNEKEANSSNSPGGCVIEIPGVGTAVSTGRGGASQ